MIKVMGYGFMLGRKKSERKQSDVKVGGFGDVEEYSYLNKEDKNCVVIGSKIIKER